MSNCYKPKYYPPEPQIDYQRTIILNTKDTLGNPSRLFKIYFNVLDGDGNVGAGTDNKTKNIFIRFYEKENGVFSEVEFEIEILMHYTIPYVDPIGLNDYYKAEILVDYSIPKIFFDTIMGDLAIDTIKFDFYIEDQDKNKSNLQETHEIPPTFFGNLIDTVTVIKY